ncbi:hypothetical protein KKF84_09160 [Myxococcota bacterium]|nr:hypothetical protein [Myxococcota bacterium]MBU1535478.1 hypothetical protein [Myxococcota bacterium]
MNPYPFFFVVFTVMLPVGCSRSTSEKHASNPSLPETTKSTSTPSKPAIPKSLDATISEDLKTKIEKLLPAEYRFYKAPMAANVYVIESLTKMHTSQEMGTFGTDSRSGSEHVKPYIAITVYPRVDPANIAALRKRADHLREKLPPQKSKSHLSAWYKQNKAALDFINSVPTYYDTNNSYKIKHSYKPDDRAQKQIFTQLLESVLRLFSTYPEK